MLAAHHSPPVADDRWPSQVRIDWTPGAAPIAVLAPPGYLVTSRLALDLSRTGSLAWTWRGSTGIPSVETMPSTEPVVIVVTDEATPDRLAAALEHDSRHGGPRLVVVAAADTSCLHGTSVTSVPAGSLLLTEDEATRAVRHAAADLDDATRCRLAHLCGGRAGLLEAITKVDDRELLTRSSSCRDIDATQRMIARATIEALDEAARVSLALACWLGYLHDDLGLDASPKAPWWQALSGGWCRLDPSWSTAVFGELASDSAAAITGLRQLIDALIPLGGLLDAVELALNLQDVSLAADLLERCAGEGVDQNPRLLEPLLGRLPTSELRNRPELLRLRTESIGVGNGSNPSAPVPGPRPDAQRSTRRLRVPGRLRLIRTPRRERGPTNKATTSDEAPLGRPGPPRLAVHMLGSLRVAVDGVEVTRWCGSQGRSLLRYLILNRHKAIPRDVLIDAFWPDTDAAVGRNRLHVALHGLRRDLRTVTDEPIVIQAHGCYALSGTLDVWVDCEEVRRLYSAGCSLEQAGLDEQAMAAYRSAQELVRGELLADAPYDDWSVPDRENQRAFHLEILERLALLQFAHADYDGCIASARQLIGDDLCREDMHRLLMRCYARKGRRHLAALQFKACMRELADELDVTADAETVALDEAIRRRREV